MTENIKTNENTLKRKKYYNGQKKNVGENINGENKKNIKRKMGSILPTFDAIGANLVNDARENKNEKKQINNNIVEVDANIDQKYANEKNVKSRKAYSRKNNVKKETSEVILEPKNNSKKNIKVARDRIKIIP